MRHVCLDSAQRWLLGCLAALIVAAAAMPALVEAHCKEPPDRRVELTITMTNSTEQEVPREWTWEFWWEANRDRYLEPMEQDHRFQGEDPAYVERIRTEAVELLREEALEHGAPRVRWEAALALGRMQEAEALPLLRRVAEQDPSEAVRERALLAIGLLDTAEAEEFLLHTDYPTAVLERAGMQALGLRSQISPAATQALQRVIEMGGPGSGTSAAWALGQHAPEQMRGVVEGTPSPWLASQAVLALGRSGDRRAHALLTEIALGSEWAEGLPAWERLKEADRAKRVMLQQARNDGERVLAEVLTWEEEDGDRTELRPGRAFARVDDRRTAMQRYNRIHNRVARFSPNPEDEADTRLSRFQFRVGQEQTMIARLRTSAVIALGQVEDRDATEALLTLLEEREDEYNVLPKRFAMTSLGRLGHETGLEALLAEADLNRPNGHLKNREMRESAARGFAALGLGLYARPREAADGSREDRPGFELAGQMLADRLLDPDETVEMRAASAMGLGLTRRTENLPALQRVTETLGWEDDLLIGYVLLARGMLGDRNIVEPAESFLSLANNRHDGRGIMARRAAVTGLGLTGRTEMIPVMREAWDLSYDVSREVIRGLAMTRARNVTELAMEGYREPENYYEEAYMCAVLGKLFEAERPSRLARFTGGDNFTMENVAMLTGREQANEFLYLFMVPAIEDRDEGEALLEHIDDH